MSDLLLRWCVDQLYHTFGLEASDDVVQYILSIENREEIAEYVGDLVQGSEGKKKQFIDELLARWQRARCPVPEGAGPFLWRETPAEMLDVAKDSLRKSKRKGRNRQELPTMSDLEPTPEVVKTPIDLLKVCTREEQQILQRDSNKSQKLRKKLMCDRVRLSDAAEKDILPREEDRMKTGLEKALQHKDKLLEFDKNSVRRTQVLDDESDYFSTDSNQWLSPGEREALRRREVELGELRHASRKDKIITLDFAGRQVLEEGDNLSQYYSRFDEAVQAINTGTLVTISQQTDNPPPRELINPNILQAAPQWVDMGSRAVRQKLQDRGVACDVGLGRAQLRLQDRELQEMFDGGWCLSMHQPWASLLITGIKRVEGRSWYSTHRGRLWIAAAAKRPTPQEISHVEYQYRQLYRTELQFPRQYPTGCLLGCVNMTDCLSQEQYRVQFPETCEESSSPFVFTCSQPQELYIKFPMKGKHMIWKLDSQYHQGARKGLMPSPNLCA